ncbi:MAG: class I SAM-dependent methyltransferase [Clostridia bacterium]|nr:class I SAM-dependent methyltransferase [Clostridia bacterium]
MTTEPATNPARRPLSLGARLDCVLDFTATEPEAACCADIGCDHGRLICAMLERWTQRTGIAADISAPSLEKAKALSLRRGLSDRLVTRVGDGLQVLAPGEAGIVIICGMGGELIARLLAACETPLMGARLAVLQPMRGTEELNAWLFENGYVTERCRVVEDAGRLYEVLAVRPPQEGKRLVFPADRPEGFFGICPFAERDALFFQLVARQLAQTEKRLATAAGTPGEAVLKTKREALLKLKGEA